MFTAGTVNRLTSDANSDWLVAGARMLFEKDSEPHLEYH